MEYILQPTAERKTPLQIVFLKSSERKKGSKISKIPQEYLLNCSFSLTVCSPEFLTSGKKKTPTKTFPFSVLK